MLTGQHHLELLEREHELRAAAEVLADAAAGEGAALLAQGPAGIGKTRLLDAVVEQATSRGFDVSGARGDELEASFPYGVVRQLFEGPVGELEAGERERLADGAAGLALSLDEPQIVVGARQLGDGLAEVVDGVVGAWLRGTVPSGCG